MISDFERKSCNESRSHLNKNAYITLSRDEGISYDNVDGNSTNSVYMIKNDHFYIFFFIHYAVKMYSYS